ncbi:MAG: DMT family transporter [Candidatus Kapaibacteriota bacterium]|jgi:drug/metabolite transporter (DMT)-like permease
MTEYKAELMLLLMTMIWGATFLFTQFGLNDCSPFLYIIIRFTIAAGLSFLFFGKKVLQASKKTILQSSLLGFFFGVGFILQTNALALTTVSKTAFITGLTVVVTPFIFILVRKRYPSKWAFFGIIISFLGLYLFTNPQFDNINTGDVLTLISTACWGFYITYMDIFTKRHNTFAETIQVVAFQFVAALPIVILGFFIFDYNGGDFRFNLSQNLLISLLFNGVIASFILTLIHTTYQKHTTPVKAALIFSLEPVFASIIAMVFINEFLNGREAIGATILMFGVLASELGFMITNYFKTMFHR